MYMHMLLHEQICLGECLAAVGDYLAGRTLSGMYLLTRVCSCENVGAPTASFHSFSF